jgi:hypothetical protein
MLFLPFQNVASVHQIAPNRMQVFKKFSGGQTPGPPATGGSAPRPPGGEGKGGEKGRKGEGEREGGEGKGGEREVMGGEGDGV